MTKPRKLVKRKASKAVKRSRKPVQKTARKAPKAAKPTAKTQKKTKAAPKFKSPHARVEGNPYRIGSSYGAAVDIIAAHPDGLTRQALIDELAKVTGKQAKTSCTFDVSVVLSGSEGAKLHSSARRGEGYVIERVNDNIRLVRGK